VLLGRRVCGRDGIHHRLCGGREIWPVTTGPGATKGVLILLYTRGVLGTMGAIKLRGAQDGSAK
jgi:hypothetical protein